MTTCPHCKTPIEYSLIKVECATECPACDGPLYSDDGEWLGIAVPVEPMANEPDRFAALAAAVRKLRADVESERAAADRRCEHYVDKGDWWHTADGNRQECEAVLFLIDALMQEHGIKK